MITERDVEFHTPPEADHHWAETNMFCFSIPEHNMACTIYTCIRAGLGAAISEVIIFNQLSRNRWDVLYVDTHQHLPAPERLSHYQLLNGLEVRVVKAPRDYRVDYHGMDGTEIHLEVVGLMEPFDIHDPDMSPNAAPRPTDQVEGSGFGAGYSGHFDMTARVTGTLTLYGRTFTVDCVDSMDHSWGPRAERGMRSMCWSGGHLGEDYVWHGIWVKNLWTKPEDEFRIAHGYILEDGKVYGLKSGTMLATRRDDHIPVALDVRLVDRDDREHTFAARALANHDWVPHTCLHVQNVFYEFQGRGLTGYGVVQEALPLEMMARTEGRRAVERM